MTATAQPSEKLSRDRAMHGKGHYTGRESLRVATLAAWREYRALKTVLGYEIHPDGSVTAQVPGGVYRIAANGAVAFLREASQ